MNWPPLFEAQGRRQSIAANLSSILGHVPLLCRKLHKDTSAMFHRFFASKGLTPCSKWTTPRKAERKISCRMQKFCRGKPPANQKATCMLWNCDSGAKTTTCNHAWAKPFALRKSEDFIICTDPPCWNAKVRSAETTILSSTCPIEDLEEKAAACQTPGCRKMSEGLDDNA